MDEVKGCYVFIDTGSQPTIAAHYSYEKPIYRFLYGQSYLQRADAFPLDPLNLSFQSYNKPYETISKDGFGVLADATPDNWGKRLTNALHRRTPLNQLEWLLASQGNSVGCIVGSLSKSHIKNNSNIIQYAELETFIQITELIEKKRDPFEMKLEQLELNKLLYNGASMGGARPKTLVMYKNKEWIAKFNKSDDLFDTCKVEYASLNMARDMGLNTCNAELTECAGRPILLVERFDRNCPERKKHYISANSLLNIQKIRIGDPKMSYMSIAKVCSQICFDAISNQKELYKRMVLNVMISNTDDHLKNHGFLMYDMKKQHYALSPLFDVLPHGMPSSFPNEHALVLGNDGRFGSYDNLISRSNAFGLNLDQARECIKDVRDVIENREKYLLDAGLKPTEIRQLEPYFYLDILKN